MTSDPVSILITDGEQRSALAIVRSLGLAGYAVHVGSRTGRSISGSSKFAASEVSLPDPLVSQEAYFDAVAGRARTIDARVLIPVTEAALRAVLGRREELTAILPFPSLVAFRRASNKQALLELARSVKVATPDQVVLDTPDTRSVPDALFPVVAKPFASVVDDDGGRRKLSVEHAADREELGSVLRNIPPSGFPVLVQERIVGDGVGVFLLRWDGRTVASFAHRRLREKPPAGGVSTYRESIRLPADWLADAERLLSGLAWQGVAMVEFKVDRHTGRPVLMEINGRFWGSLQLAVDAGVDFPRLLVGAAVRDEVPDTQPTYALGVRSRWFWGDVDHLLLRLTRTRAALSLAPEAPGRLETVRDFSRFWRRSDRLEVLRWDDLKPFLRETLLWIRGS